MRSFFHVSCFNYSNMSIWQFCILQVIKLLDEFWYNLIFFYTFSLRLTLWHGDTVIYTIWHVHFFYQLRLFISSVCICESLSFRYYSSVWFLVLLLLLALYIRWSVEKFSVRLNSKNLHFNVWPLKWWF